MNNIEVEIRSFLTKDKYDELIDYFKQNAKQVKDDYQETFYFDCEEDLRIQKNNYYAKVWMKKGKLHDDHREEIEIKFEKEQFDELEKLFLALKYDIEIKWFRKRLQFEWEDITVCLDDTKGFGYVIELEKMCIEENKEEEYNKLKTKLEELNVNISSKEEFKEKFEYYKNNWRELTK